VANLPKLNIPVTVSTAGVEKGLKAAEAKVDASARRMATKSAKAAAAGASGASLAQRVAPVVGGVGKLGAFGGFAAGFGGAGIAVAAPFALVNMARAYVDTLAAATAGANDALAKYRLTGELTKGMNVPMLTRMAALERQAQADAAKPGFMESFALASAKPGERSMASYMADLLPQTGAFFGALAGGGTKQEAYLQAQLATANNLDAPSIASEIQRLQKQKERNPFGTSVLDAAMIGVQQGLGFSNPFDTLERIAIQMGRM